MTIPQSKPLLINLNVNNKTYDLPTTASAVGIDLNTGSNDTSTWYTVHDQNSSDATITASRYTLTQVFYFNKNY